MLSIIVAMDKNNVIGLNNDLPWHLPNDLQFFKEKTTGHTIIMGRKTFESLGRVLPNRKHIVLTRSEATFPEEVVVMHDIEELLHYAEKHNEDELFIIGGAILFEQMLQYTDRLYITYIEGEFEGDTFFPPFNINEWREVSRSTYEKDERNTHTHHFVQYDRIEG